MSFVSNLPTTVPEMPEYQWNDDGTPVLQFTNSQQGAQNHRRRITQPPGLDPAEDITISAVQQSRERWIQRMMMAVYDLSQANDNPSARERLMFTVGNTESVNGTDVEAACRELFDVLIDRCRHGYRGPVKENRTLRLRSGNEADRDGNCLTRINNVVMILREWKAACRDILYEFSKLIQIANAPLSYARCKVDNQHNNKTKKAQIQRSNAIINKTHLEAMSANEIVSGQSSRRGRPRNSIQAAQVAPEGTQNTVESTKTPSQRTVTPPMSSNNTTGQNTQSDIEDQFGGYDEDSLSFEGLHRGLSDDKGLEVTSCTSPSYTPGVATFDPVTTGGLIHPVSAFQPASMAVPGNINPSQFTIEDDLSFVSTPGMSNQDPLVPNTVSSFPTGFGAHAASAGLDSYQYQEPTVTVSPYEEARRIHAAQSENAHLTRQLRASRQPPAPPSGYLRALNRGPAQPQNRPQLQNANPMNQSAIMDNVIFNGMSLGTILNCLADQGLFNLPMRGAQVPQPPMFPSTSHVAPEITGTSGEETPVANAAAEATLVPKRGRASDDEEEPTTPVQNKRRKSSAE